MKNCETDEKKEGRKEIGWRKSVEQRTRLNDIRGRGVCIRGYIGKTREPRLIYHNSYSAYRIDIFIGIRFRYDTHLSSVQCLSGIVKRSLMLLRIDNDRHEFLVIMTLPRCLPSRRIDKISNDLSRLVRDHK